MTRRLGAALLVAALFATVTVEEGQAFTRGQRAALTRAVRATMKGTYAPGIVIGLWFPGHGTWVRAFGTERRGKRLRVDDRFRLGSITKTFTGTVVLQLVQEGKLSLEQPLSDFFPGVPNAAGITIRQLLNHTSGIQTTADTTNAQLFRNPHRRFKPDEVIAQAVVQPYTPNGVYNYSNTNYLLLGRIVEMVTHHSLSYELTHRVLRPLRLRHTAFLPNSTPKCRFAHGYAFFRERWIDVASWTTSWAWAAGSVVSSLADLKRYARALATGRGLLSPATQAQRLTFVPTGSPGLEYGLGIFQLGLFLGHDGGIPGYNTLGLYSPTLKATVVIMMETTPEILPPPGSLDIDVLALGEVLVNVALAKHTVDFPHGIGRRPIRAPKFASSSIRPNGADSTGRNRHDPGFSPWSTLALLPGRGLADLQ